MLSKEIRKFYFSTRGRVTQRAYNTYLLPPVLAVPPFLYILNLIIPLDSNFGLQVIVMMICMTTLWAFIAVSVKRCHDRGKRAEFLGLLFVPVVGWIWVMLELIAGPTRTGPNLYGDDPEWD